MHVALFTDLHPATRGGTQISVDTQRRSLEQLGHRVTVFAPPLGKTQAPDPNLVELKPVPVVARLAQILSRYDDFVFVWPSPTNGRLIDAAFASREPVDIVHAQGDLGVAMAGVEAARRHGIPVVQTKHSRYDAYFDQATPAPLLLSIIISRMQKLNVTSELAARNHPESRAARLAWNFMVAHAQSVDHVIMPTRHFAQALAHRGVTRPISVISNGIDDDDIAHAASAPIARSSGAGSLRLIWCGRLSAEKRILEAVEAVSRIPNCTLDVYGSGLLEPALRQTIASAGLSDRVRLHGWVDHAECMTVMRSSDALLFTSHGFDTQGLVLLEAAAMALPIVYCDPALSESVPDGGGILAADSSPGALADVIGQMAEDRGAVTTMAATLSALRAVPRQSVQTEEILAVYRSLIAGD